MGFKCPSLLADTIEPIRVILPIFHVLGIDIVSRHERILGHGTAFTAIMRASGADALMRMRSRVRKRTDEQRVRREDTHRI